MMITRHFDNRVQNEMQGFNDLSYELIYLLIEW